MEKLLIIFFSLLISLPALAQNWSGVSECGLYRAQGIARTTNKGPVIVVNEKSRSEVILSVSLISEVKLAPYIDRAIVVTIAVNKNPKSQHFTATIKEIKSRIPNPLSPNDTGINIISKEKCQ
jgi:hypothetical protein